LDRYVLEKGSSDVRFCRFHGFSVGLTPVLKPGLLINFPDRLGIVTIETGIVGAEAHPAVPTVRYFINPVRTFPVH